MDRIEKLYIYEIAGDVDPSSMNMGAGFIGCWGEADHSYLFYHAPNKKEISRLLIENPQFKFISETEMNYDQWEPSDALRPFEIHPLTFMPAWMAKENSNPMEIQLDPGVVFGAGTHSTTYKCLELLISLMKEEPIKKVVDLGTGTGILALAAAKMGAAEVIAIDNNNLAVETTNKNVKLNNLENIINCNHADAKDFLEVEADLTLANLVLWELEKIFVPNINYGSQWYIISGLNRTEVKNFKEQLKILPLKIVLHEMDNLWSTLLLKKSQ